MAFLFGIALMHLRLRLDLSSTRAWHVDLLRALKARPGTRVDVEHRAAPAMPPGAARLFRFESLVHGGAAESAAAPVPPQALDCAASAGTPDLVIDLTGRGGSAGEREWRLLFDGAPGEAALFAALVDGRHPVVELRAGERRVAAGRPGTDLHGQVQAAFGDALARTVTLIIAALDGAPSASPMAEAAAPRPQPFGTVRLGALIARRLTGAVGRRLHRMRHHDPNWRIGWRRLDGPDLFDLQAHPVGGWRDLPDDGRRFYADPFPIEHEGGLYLFVEEYPHATGKGIISAIPFGPDGPEGVPEPVLERPTHLSYPFVFARDGEVWMVPESCAAGTVDLFRATRFPGGWVKEATLVPDVTASDATLVEHEGQWWLFATVRGTGGSTSDALHLWSAPDFRGPWTAHPRNPVLIDSASARPAGRMVERGGVLWRPVQDCRATYGGALGLARVLRLDAQGFDQTVEAVLKAGPRWPGHLLHTANQGGGFEFIDGSGQGRKRAG